MGLFKNKKLQCVRCGKRHEDNHLIGIYGVLICPDCMDVVEKIKAIVECYEAARAIASSLTNDGVYLSDFNPAANNIMVLEGIDKIIAEFGADSDIHPKTYKSFKYKDCGFMQMYKDGA